MTFADTCRDLHAFSEIDAGGTAAARPSRPLRATFLLAALMSVLLLTPAVSTAQDATTGDGDAAALPAETLDDVSRELAETAARLEELDAEIARGQARRKTLEASAGEFASRAGERDARVSQLARDIAGFESTLSDLEARVARERGDIEQRRERLAHTLRQTLQVNAASGLRVLLGHADPGVAGRLGVYADYALRAQRRAVDAQVAVLARIETARERALKDRNWLEHIKRKASRQRDERVAEQLAHAEQLASVDGELADKTRTVAQLGADRERLQALFDELEALQSSASGYFMAGQGHYPWPVNGRVNARFGDLKSVGKIRWNGVFIEAAEGTAVTAIADGEVVYASRLRGFGLLVVVDHGDDFMTLYGGNRAVMREVGDWVEAGANIATVGESSGQSVSGVYFEVREASEPVDPEIWLAPRGTASRGS